MSDDSTPNWPWTDYDSLVEQLATARAECERLRGLDSMQKFLAWTGHDDPPRPDIYARNMRELKRLRADLARAQAVVEAAVKWKASDCSTDCPLSESGSHTHHCPERIVTLKLCGAIDAYLAAQHEAKP